MKKLFISQPMKGKSDEDILAERKKAIKSAEQKIGEPVEVIDSFFPGSSGGCKAPLVLREIPGAFGWSRHRLLC